MSYSKARLAILWCLAVVIFTAQPTFGQQDQKFPVAIVENADGVAGKSLVNSISVRFLNDPGYKIVDEGNEAFVTLRISTEKPSGDTIQNFYVVVWSANLNFGESKQLGGYTPVYIGHETGLFSESNQDQIVESIMTRMKQVIVEMGKSFQDDR